MPFAAQYSIPTWTSTAAVYDLQFKFTDQSVAASASKMKVGLDYLAQIRRNYYPVERKLLKAEEAINEGKNTLGIECHVVLIPIAGH